MSRVVEIPDGVRLEVGKDPINQLVQWVMLPPDSNEPLLTIGIHKPTAIAQSARLLAAVEQLDELEANPGLKN